MPITNHDLTSDIRVYAVQNVTEITTQGQLAAINTDRTALAGRYILLNDIALDENKAGFDIDGWKPIGNESYYYPFNGIFNGNNHKITNLWINRPSTESVGLFSIIEGAQIRNLGVETDGIKGDNFVGAIAGDAYDSNITNSYSKGDISAYGAVGGIVGHFQDGDLADSYSTGNINGSSDVGGIAGVFRRGSITNSHSTGNISCLNSGLGGIAGILEYANITNSYSTGRISSGNFIGEYPSEDATEYPSEFAGGIAGITAGDSLILNSYSTGDVRGTRQHIGGITGYNGGASIVNSYSTGNISGNVGVGGIAGYSEGESIIINSYAAGNIIGNNYYEETEGWIGGIVGVSEGESTIIHNAAVNPSVIGTGDTNRITGFIYGGDIATVSPNFAWEGIAGSFTHADDEAHHGTDKTMDELKTQAVYESLGWRFGDDNDNPWKIDEAKNNGLPYFYWQEL